MVVANYAQFGGRHCETGALGNVLAYWGVRAPHTGAPFTEEMLLGIGGGIGMSYWVFQFGEIPFFFIGTRYGEKGPGSLFQEQICRRLGLKTEVRETSSAKRGAADLEASLTAGKPVVAWVDMPMLPYLCIPPQAHFGGHAIVVYGIENGRALIADRGRYPVSVTAAELAEARGSKFKPYPPNNRIMEVEPPRPAITASTLERAVVRGISDTCRLLLRGPIKNIGLQALPKWAALLCDEKNAKGWPTVFRKPVDLYGALMSAYMFIEIGGTGGSAFRPMYAAFLMEAAEVLGQPRLKEVSAMYADCGKLWSAVANAALPDWAPELRETRELLARKNRIFEDEGDVAAMQAINRRLEVILAGAKKRFPAPPGSVPDLLDGLRQSILQLHKAELQAAKALDESVR